MCVVPDIVNIEVYGDIDCNLDLHKIRDTFVEWLASKSNKNSKNEFTEWEQGHDPT